MENAQLYSSSSGMQRRDAEEVIREFRGRLNWTDGARVLDIGCGTGEVTSEVLLPHLPKGFSQLTGIDVSPEMIQFARKVHNHPQVNFIQFDIAHEADNILLELNTKLDNNNIDVLNNNGKIKILLNDTETAIEDAKEKLRGYDIISSFYCLHWIPNQSLALENIRQLLRPGGEALLVLLAKSPIFSLYDKLSSIPVWKEYMQDVENFISPYHRSDDPLADFLTLIRSVGLETVKTECRERNYVFQSTSSLRNAIIAVNPFISRIPNQLRDQFVSDCLKETEELKLTELNNKGHKVAYKLLIAHLRRPV